MRAHLVALLLPLVVAGVVLASVAANRSEGRGPTVLGHVDVSLAYRDSDRSVAEVRLMWSEPVGAPGAWLSRDDLSRLGFDVSVEPDAPNAERHYRRRLTRRAYVAFELNGPAWDAVRRQREQTEPGGPAPPPLARPVAGSRLVPVAAAADPQSLADRYPDPRTHLIARAIVGVQWYSIAGRPSVAGRLVSLDPNVIQVPGALAARLPGDPVRPFQAPPFTIDVMYGRRWEPWVVAVTPGGASR